MESSWVFGCIFGLRQKDCSRYEADLGARGYGRWGGCASCRWREPANDTTADAEHNWAMRDTLRSLMADDRQARLARARKVYEREWADRLTWREYCEVTGLDT